MENGEKQACTELDKNQLIEIWKHFAATGGADKERMVTITTWILGFSAAILGYLAINLIDYSCFCVKEPATKTTVLSSLGALVSAYGARIVLLYAGYANWNWAKADSLACQLKTKFKIRELVPPGLNCKESPEPTTGPVSWPPFGDLYPIFQWFLIGAVFLLILHLAAFVLSFDRICGAATQRTPPQGGWLLFATLEIANTGNAPARLVYEEGDPFLVTMADFDQQGKPVFGRPTTLRVPQARDPSASALATIVRASGQESLPFVLRLERPGLYLLSFRAQLCSEDRESLEGLGIPEWLSC